MSELRPLRVRAPMTPPVALRLPEAAKSLGISVKSVRRLIGSGELAASRLGRILVVEVRSLESLLARTRVGGHA